MFSLMAATLVVALPQSLLDPSFDKFFQNSGSFNQQFNQVQQQQIQRPQISQQSKTSQQITNPAITSPPIVRYYGENCICTFLQHQSFRSRPSFPSSQSQTNIREGVSVRPPTLGHAEALERHALQKQQLAEVVSK